MARTRAASSARDGSTSTRARSVARFTSAARTPATPRRASSTLATHDAHVIPVTTSSRRSTLSSVFAGFVAMAIPPLFSTPSPQGVGSCQVYFGRTPTLVGMRVLLFLAILSLEACGSAGSRVSPAPSTPAATPSETAPVRATGPGGAPIASMSVTGAPAYVRAQVTQSAPVLLPETAALPGGVKADVMARPDGFSITYSAE